MKKISTLFKKDPNDLGRVTNEVDDYQPEEHLGTFEEMSELAMSVWRAEQEQRDRTEDEQTS